MGAVLPFIGPAISVVQGIGSGIGGKQQQQELNKSAAAQQDMFARMGQSNLDTADYLRGQGERYANPALGERLMNDALNLGGTLRGIASTEAGNIGAGGFMEDARAAIGQAGNFDPFSFEQAQSTREQAMRFADEMGGNARQNATAQAALASRNFGSQLDAQLAQRGLSRDSGQAAGALSDFATQQALGRAGLEAQLAEQAGQLGLQASQFDVQSGLALSDLGSRYNLGMNQLTSGAALGQAQALSGLQALGDQQAIQRAGLLSSAETQGLGAAQNAYQQNYLNPMMNAQNILGTLASYQGGYAQSGLSDLLRGQQDAVKQTGAGFSSGVSGGFAQLANLLGNNGSGDTGAPPNDFLSMILRAMGQA